MLLFPKGKSNDVTSPNCTDTCTRSTLAHHVYSVLFRGTGFSGSYKLVTIKINSVVLSCSKENLLNLLTSNVIMF